MRSRVDSNQKMIVDALRACGVAVFVTGRPVDLLASRQGRTYLLEVKESHSAPFTPFQEDFIPTWQDTVHVVTTIEEALAAVGLA